MCAIYCKSYPFMLLDLRTDHLKIAQDILQKFVPERAVWAFGSRAKWTAKEYSDLDLCIVGKTPLSFRTLGLLQEAFEDSDLPYKVDVVDWATTSDSFRKIIERDRVVVQRAAVGRVSAKRVTRQEPDAVASGDASVPEDVGLRCANPTCGGEWRSSTLGGFVRIQRGHDLTASEQQTGDIPIMGSAGQNGTHSIALANGPGVVVGRSGASAGRVHFSAVDYWPHNTCLYVTDFLGNNPRFAYYLLQTLDLASFNSGSAQPSLNRNFLYAIPVRIPPRLEQDYIVALLQSLDDRITLLRETNATLEAIAQALFKSWFVDFDPVRANIARRSREGGNPDAGGRSEALDSRLRGNDGSYLDAATAALFPDSFEESELGLVPRGWRVGTLADLAEFQNGYAFKSKDWVESGHPVVKIGDVKPGIIDFSGCTFVATETTSGLNRFRLNRGDLLVGMTGYVGETGLVAEVEPAAYLNQRVGRIATTNGMKDGGFVYCLVRGDEFKTYAVAQSHGSAQANVSGSALLNYLSVIPSGEVMPKFNELIYPILETILSNHEQAQTIATLRDTLLPRLISGQLRLPPAQAAAKEALA